MLSIRELEPGAISVFKVDLDDVHLSTRRDLLAPDELARADRFRFDVHRNRFIAGRAALRTVLGHYTRISPETVQFAYTSNGKPFLANHNGSLSFNLSNSENFCLIAAGMYEHIGVDIEKMVLDKELMAIAGRFFAPAEVDQLMTLPAERRGDAFYSCWTRKEAFVKAHGSGLAYGLDKFEVTAIPEEPARLLAIHCETPPIGTSSERDINDASSWSMFNLEVDRGYAAALAVHGKVDHVTRFDWEHAI